MRVTGCYPPVITLIPGLLTLASPIQYQRSRDFSISSTIQLNCNGSLLTTTTWTIKNCTAISCLSSIMLDQRVITTLSELYIPPKTLPYGTYELKLTVTMSAVPNVTSSSTAYVQIIPTGVIANLLQRGTSMISHGSQQDLSLDPGRYSVDLDEDSFDATVSVDRLVRRSVSLLNHCSRNGLMNIIVDCMIRLTSQRSMVFYYPSMILVSIQTIHRVSSINQVKAVYFFSVRNYLYL